MHIFVENLYIMKITGTLKSIGETQVLSEKFKKREFVLEIDQSTQYPQTILLEFHNAKCDELNGKAVGVEYNVDFNLKGRQWTDSNGVVKTFNTLNAWKIEATGETQATPTPTTDNNDLPY